MSSLVADFPDTLHISVTQHDIDTSRESIRAYSSPFNGFKCPIARSLQRRFPGAHIQVTASLALIHEDSAPGPFPSVIYDLPYRAMDFIEDFDNDLNVLPSRFTLERNHA